MYSCKNREFCYNSCMIGKNERKPENAQFIKFLRWPILAGELLTFIFLAVSLIRLNILPEWQTTLVCTVLALIFAFTTFKLFRRRTHTAVQVFILLLAGFLTGVAIYASSSLNQTIAFIQNLTKIKTKTVSYSVLVKADSDFKAIDDLKDKTIGFIGTDKYAEQSKLKLKDAINFEAKDAPELGSLVANFEAHDTAAMALAQTYIDLFKENNEEYFKELKVIYTYEIQVKDEAEEEQSVNTQVDPFIVYISGSDSRNGISATARSDVNIIAAINPKTAKILLVSIPRDYYVQLHGTTGTKDKLTHAGIYGVDMSKNTIEDLLGINVNYTLKVSFDTVINIVDAIDGIDIYSDQAFTAWTDRSCSFVEGTQHVDAKCALAFARERYSYASGDRHRGENQEAVIKAIFDKVMSPKYLVNYTDLLKAIDGSFEISMSYDEITGFAKKQLSEMKSWTIENQNLDGTGAMLPTYSMGAQHLYVMIPNETTISDAKAKITEVMGN